MDGRCCSVLGKEKSVSSRILESMGGIDTDKFNKLLEVVGKLDSICGLRWKS